MHEIIYIQAGNLSNYIGTHFWNTQETYFDYNPPSGPDDKHQREDPIVDHDISFRQGVSMNGTETYCPRLLLLDSRDNFGSLGKTNELYTPDDLSVNISALPSGQLDEIRQPLKEPSDYQKALAAEGVELHEEEGAQSPGAGLPYDKVQSWSDFNRVYYVPRSLHLLPCSPLGAEDSWAAGLDMFKRIDHDSAIAEDSFRPFAEECDLLQGIQTSLDVSSFGSFAVSLLERVRDEYTKTPVLAHICMSAPRIISNYENPRLALQIVNDALVIRDLLASLATLTIPLQPPSVWPAGSWSSLRIHSESHYHSSAVLSAHMESATFPMRAKNTTVSFNALCGQLNWRGDTPIAHLSGAFLPQSVTPSDAGPTLVPIYDFSLRVDHQNKIKGTQKSGTLFAQQAVLRANAGPQTQNLRDWVESSAKDLREPLLSRLPYAQYPIPSSYPQFFSPTDSVESSATNKSAQPSVKAVSAISLLSATSETSRDILAMAGFVSQFRRRGRFDSEAWSGIGRDELNELAEDLIRIGESYGGGGWDDEGEEVMDD